MASSSKKRTTMAKLARENKLREKRMEKQARKDARRYAAAEPPHLEGEEQLDTHAEDPVGAETAPGPAETAPGSSDT
jgi:hypothetical protein